MNQQIVATTEPILPEETAEPVETISAQVLLLGGVGALSGAAPTMDAALQADCEAHDLRVSALSACDGFAAAQLLRIERAGHLTTPQSEPDRTQQGRGPHRF